MILLQLDSVDHCEKWIPPRHGFLKLNCDGSVNNFGRNAGCGGVLRDHGGRFIFAFSRRLEQCTVIEAELQGILHGIRIAWSKGHCQLEVETDSSEAVESIIGALGMMELCDWCAKSWK